MSFSYLARIWAPKSVSKRSGVLIGVSGQDDYVLIVVAEYILENCVFRQQVQLAFEGERLVRTGGVLVTKMLGEFKVLLGKSHTAAQQSVFVAKRRVANRDANLGTNGTFRVIDYELLDGS